jgi:hypothetical protein
MRSAFIRAVVLLALTAAAAHAEVEVTLKKPFIEKYRNRVTIETQFRIDHAKKTINSAAKDGDLHISGRPGSEIGLMTVAEIQNARSVLEAVTFARDNAGSGTPVSMSGVWRVWFEHAGGTDQVQGKPLKPATDTNPDHVFEIHPVTRIGEHGLLATLKPIPGYEAPKNTATRIRMAETMRANMRVKKSTVTIRTGGNNPNYIRFLMKKLPGPHGFQRPSGTWTQPQDGMYIFAKIYDLDEELLARKRRIAFVLGSEPFQKAQNLQANHCLDVLGITRVNLELISWRMRNAKKRPEVLTWNLPYELVAVGVDGESRHCAEEEDEQ